MLKHITASCKISNLVISEFEYKHIFSSATPADMSSDMEMEFLGSPEIWDEDVHPDENNPPETEAATPEVELPPPFLPPV